MSCNILKKMNIKIKKLNEKAVIPRSSACNYHLIQANCVGVIDSGYRGELIIRHKKVGEKVYAVGERVAQIMIISYPKVSFVEVDELSETDRGKGNFGSSGK